MSTTIPMRTEPLSSEDREDLFDSISQQLRPKVFTAAKDERAVMHQLTHIRQALRSALEKLERAYSPDEIVNEAEGEAIERMRGESQILAEATVSLERRLARLAVEAVLPHAYRPFLEGR